MICKMKIVIFFCLSDKGLGKSKSIANIQNDWYDDVE